MSMKPPIPHDESLRLEILKAYDILDSSPEADFDEIVQLASQLCNTPISLITLVDEHRQWFKSRIGVGVQETTRDISFCGYTILDNRVMLVPDATKDDRFADNPLVTGDPHIRFYAGVPLVAPGGERLGTLCVIDSVPRTLTVEQVSGLKILSKQVMKQFELRKKVRQLKDAMELVEQRNSRLNELNEVNSRLLSVIGHDVKTPLQNLLSLLRVLENGSSSFGPEQMRETFAKINGSIWSANQLLENLLQWALYQIDAYTPRVNKVNIRKLVERDIKLIAEEAAKKGNEIRNTVDENVEAVVDGDACSFVVRNLISNANKFTSSGVIMVSAETHADKLELRVKDSGLGMAKEIMDNVFSWKERNTRRGTMGESGTGIGLKVTHDIVLKAGGEISLSSTQGAGSEFTVRFPLVKGK